jgi:hypothetical protein
MGRAAISLLLRAQGGEATPPMCLLVPESTVGPAPGMRRLELKAAISHPAAWSLWRDQLETESASSPVPPVASLTLEGWSRMEVSAARRDPPRTDPVPV